MSTKSIPKRIPISLLAPPSKENLDGMRAALDSAKIQSVSANKRTPLDKADVASSVLTTVWFVAIFIATAMVQDTALVQDLVDPDRLGDLNMLISPYLPAMIITLLWVILSKASVLGKAAAVLACAGSLVFSEQSQYLKGTAYFAGFTLFFLAIWASMIRFVGYGFVKSTGSKVIDPTDPIRSFGKAKQLGLLVLTYVVVFGGFYQISKIYRPDYTDLTSTLSHPVGEALTIALITSVFVSRLVVRFLTVGGGFVYLICFSLLGVFTFNPTLYNWLSRVLASIDQFVRESPSANADRTVLWDNALSVCRPFIEILCNYWQPIYLLNALLLVFLISFRWLGYRIDTRGV